MSCYYYDFDSDTTHQKDYREKIFADIEHAMVRLDELWGAMIATGETR